MAKTIQIRVDDQLKDSADLLFSSLGLDTSTAIRMFLVASMEEGGIPFPVKRRNGRDIAIKEAISRRKSGARFYTIEECLSDMDGAITEESAHATV
ncbi:MAG: type II toxin-antitoxin system RelB/DinJ family antitoxin [Oscillospiraceae bacterium]|nr:type II toxin-antitoxin system RelB/DinJ family antitoxin [Oscillospiraceae bacterium]